MMDGNYLLGFMLSQAICDNMISIALLNSNKGHCNHPQHSEKKRTKLFYIFVFKNYILQTACILSQITLLMYPDQAVFNKLHKNIFCKQIPQPLKVETWALMMKL